MDNNSNSNINGKYSKKEVLKFLSQIGIDTRFISYCYNTIFINNIRFSKFSKAREETFKKYYPNINIIRSKTFQKIAIKSSRVLSNVLTPRDRVLTFKCQNTNDFILSIVLEPYTRKYGIEIIKSDYTLSDLENSNWKNIDNIEFDSIAISNTLNNESLDVIIDIFNGNKFNFDNSIFINNVNIKTIKPLSIVSDNLINSFFNSLKLDKNNFFKLNNIFQSNNDNKISNADYNNFKLEFEFMEFAESIVPNFKENIIKSHEYIRKNNTNNIN
ncbi:MAG: hypothetical protein ACRC1M_03905 [Methanobacteriaceae archaeon]